MRVASRKLVSQHQRRRCALGDLKLRSGRGGVGGGELGHGGLAEVAAADQPLVVLLDQQAPGQPQQGIVMGNTPTTSLRRPISRLTRSNGFVERNFEWCAAGKA